MNEQTIERVAKHMAAFNGDPDAWGAYASQAVDVVKIALPTIADCASSYREFLSSRVGEDVWGEWRLDESSLPKE